MADDRLVWNASFSVKATPSSIYGDMTIQQVTELMNQKMLEGFKVISSHVYHAEQDAFRMYVCMAKQ